MSRKSIYTRRIIAALAAVLLTGGPVLAGDDLSLDEARAVISEKFGMIQPEHVQRSPIDGWYMIQKGSVIAYVTADGRYLLQGDLIDLDSQVNLSELSRNGARHDLVAAFGEENAISFVPEEVKYKVTVFTDVDCTYCRKLHSQIDAYLDQGIEVQYVLYPRNGPASKTWKTSQDVWCADDRAEALTAAKQGRKVDSQQCDASMVNEHYALGRNIGLSGTPAIVFEDGTLVGGYVAPEQLIVRLQQNAQK
jgi:thiol:disulfide interchange protein DsbC